MKIIENTNDNKIKTAKFENKFIQDMKIIHIVIFKNEFENIIQFYNSEQFFEENH